MTSRIDELAEEAADPIEAGRKMRQVYFSHCKLTNRQLTIDLLRKLIERGVGTHEVEILAQKLIKREPRRSPEIIKALLQLKLDDAVRWRHRIFRQSLKEKADLYRVINRRGLVKEQFWSALRLETAKIWSQGKDKNQRKADRLEGIYKGAKPYTGMVGNIRVGDNELGHEDDIEKVPLAVGVEVNQAEAQVLNLDPKFRDWCKITMEDIETDLDVGLDNLRREIDRVEQNDGKSLSEADEALERQFTNPIDYEAKEIDFGKQRSTAMKQNKYFEMSRPVNRKDEMRIQTLKTRLMETARNVLKDTNDEKGLPKVSCFNEQEKVGLKSLVRRRKQDGLVICATDKSQSCGVMAEQEWLNSLEPHVKDDQEASIEEVDQAEKRMMGTSFQLARALRMGVGHGQEEKVMQNLRSESVAIPNMTAKIKDNQSK